MTWLSADDTWAGAAELQTLVIVMEQDTFDMESVQRGLNTLRSPTVMLSPSQESMIGWRHDLLTEYVEGGQAP